MIPKLTATYEGKPAFRVAYIRDKVANGLANFLINGKEVIERRVGYILVFANGIQEARQTATRKLYSETGSLTRKIDFCNTERWDGEPFEGKKLIDSYEEYMKRQQGLIE